MNIIGFIRNSYNPFIGRLIPIPDKLEKQPSNFRAKFGMKILAKYL
jgi:hypothetical protein